MTLQRLIRSPSDWGLAVLLAGLALMRFVPGPELGTLVFLAGAGCLTYIATTGKSPAPGEETCVASARQLALWLLTALLIAALLGLVAGHPIEAVAKSAVPFLTLVWAIFVVVPQVGSTLRLEKLLIIVSSIWALRLMVAGLIEFLDGTSLKWLRLTLVDADAVVPFPLIVLPLVLFSRQPLSRSWRGVALVLQLAVVVWSGYRSQQLLVAAMLLLALGQLAMRRPAAFLVTVLAIGTAATLGFAALKTNSEGSLLAAQLERYTAIHEEGAESGRALERRFALDRFSDYPLLGAGLGLQVPASITYASTEIEEDYDLPETVSYLHNVLFYLLMSGGLPFLVAYLALWVIGMRECRCLWVQMALVALFAFIQVEATFLQVHFSVLLALLVGRRFADRAAAHRPAHGQPPETLQRRRPSLAKDS